MLKQIKKVIRNIGQKIEGFNEVEMSSNIQEDIDALRGTKEKLTDEQLLESIDRDIKLLESGQYGESSVLYELKNSGIPMYCLKNVRLDYSDLSAQIDFLIVTNKYMCVIESKSLSGDIKIHNDGRFERFIKNKNGKVIKRNSIYSPIEQNDRHGRLVEKLLKEKDIIKRCPVYRLVVLTNPSSNVDKRYATKETKGLVIRTDQVRSKLEELNQKTESINLMFEAAMDAIDEIKSNDKIASRNYKNPMIQKYRENQQAVQNKVQEEIHEEIQEIAPPQEDKKLQELDKALREYRKKMARETGLKPYMVFYDAHLNDVLDKKPTTLSALKSVEGFNGKRGEKYGEEIVKLVNEFVG